MKRMPLLFLLLTLGCGGDPGPLATDDVALDALYEKGGPKNMLLTGDIDHVAGPAYFNEVGQANFWRRRVAEFAVKDGGEGVYTYARYAGDAMTIVGTMKVDVMCGAKEGQYAAVAGPIVEASGIYASNVGVWYLGYVEDGGTPGVNGDRFRANYETSLDGYDGANPGQYACEVVDLLTDDNLANNSVPATWTVTRNGDGSLLDRVCDGVDHTYGDTWPDGILDSEGDRLVACNGGVADFPVWYTSWPDDPLYLSPALGGNLKVH